MKSDLKYYPIRLIFWKLYRLNVTIKVKDMQKSPKVRHLSFIKERKDILKNALSSVESKLCHRFFGATF